MSTVPRLSVPRTAHKGEVIQIKTLIAHPMESGQRQHSTTGEVIPRKILHKFICTFNGQEVFSADWYPAMAANPFLTFYAVLNESGTFECTWTDDDGTTYVQSAAITVR